MGKLSRKLKRAKLDKKDRKNAAVGGSSMAIMGAAVGLVGGPLAPFTVPACALVGGLIGSVVAVKVGRDARIDYIDGSGEDPLSQDGSAKPDDHVNSQHDNRLFDSDFNQEKYMKLHENGEWDSADEGPIRRTSIEW